MTTTFTGNVILTTSKAVIDKIFFNKNSIPFNIVTNILTETEIQNSIICSPSNNTNLISFDYNFNGDQRSGHVLTIRFVETGSLFEEYYLNRDADSEIAARILKDIKNKNNSAKLGERNVAAIESSFINNRKLVTSDFIYFSFGVGPNLNDWAGPFMGNLINCDMFIGENGIREIEMKFGVQPGFLMRNVIETTRAKQFETAINRYEFITRKSIKNPNVQSVTVSSNYTDLKLNLSSLVGALNNLSPSGLSPEERAYRIGAGEYAVRVAQGESKTSLRRKDKNFQQYLEGISSNLISFSNEIQKTIKFLIINYISSISKENAQITGNTKNVIVLLPNFSESLNKSLTDYLLDNSPLIYNLAIASAGQFGRTSKKEEIRLYNEYLRSCRDIIIKYTSFFCQLVMSPQLNAVQLENLIDLSRPGNSRITTTGGNERFKKRLVEYVGIDFIGSNGYEAIAETWNRESNKFGSNDTTIDGKGAGLDIFSEYVRVHGFEIAIPSNSDERDRSLETTPDYYLPLAKFNKSIGELISKQGYAYDPTFMVENDLRVLSVWKKLGIIADDTKPAYIFGDSNLIQRLIYLSDVRAVESLLQTPQGPIHPDDLQKFGNPEYRSLIYTLFNEMSFNSSFKEDVFEKDELAIFQDPQVKALTQIGRYPVFRYNVRNPNVLAVSFKNLNAYRAVYEIGFQYKAFLPFINSTSKFYLDSLSGTDVNDFEGLVDDCFNYFLESNLLNSDFKTILQNVLTTFETKFSPRDFTDKFGTPIEKNDLATFFAAAIFRKLNPPNIPYIDIKDAKELPTLQEELRRGLNRFSNFLNIRTVPFFKISGAKAFGYPSLFVGMNNAAGTNEKKPAFFTGLYQINGFRHVITPKDMYSEFSLIKNQDSSIFKNVLDENLNKVDAEPALNTSGP